MARPRGIGLLRAPGGPAGAFAADGLHVDAVHRAGGHAQLAARALGLDHGVHALVAADDAVDGAGLDAQGAADAPVLVDPGHAARPFEAMVWIQGHHRLAGERGQPAHALGTAGRALVDRRLANGHGACVAGAVRVAAARALSLRQGVQQALDQGGRWFLVGHGPRDPPASQAAGCVPPAGRAVFRPPAWRVRCWSGRTPWPPGPGLAPVVPVAGARR